MIGTLASISLRGLLNRRRTLLLVLFGALLVLVAFLSRLSGPSEADAREFTDELLAGFGLAVLLPIVAVIVGTAAIGSELEDGTIIYLLAKPIPRALIVAVKAFVSWVVVLVLVVPPVLLAGFVAAGGDAELALAYAGGAAVGAAEYTAIFVALSLITSRALVVGLAYVVIWEGAVAGLFEGTRVVSVRQHAVAVADALANGALDADLALGTAAVAAAALTVLGIVIAIRRLERVELRGETG